MKKISTIFLLIITLTGYSQMPRRIAPSARHNSFVGSSDMITIDHELNLKDPDPFLYAGFRKIRDGQFEAAIKDLSMALENSKKNHEYIYFYRGLAKHSGGDYKNATIDFTRCLLINSSMADAYFRRGLSKYALGEYESACRDFQKTLQPGKTLYTTSSKKIHEVITAFCENVQIDTLLLESLAGN